jgi:hypothetical protein
MALVLMAGAKRRTRWGGRKEQERRDMDLSRVLAETDGALQDVSDAAVIADWISMDDIEAFSAIMTQVKTSHTADVERLDSLLRGMTANHFDPAVRARLVKFYAMFKIVELLRYEKFHGFPD